MKNRRHGLTLVELLVVLLILAVLTTIAVQATDNLALQARFEATQRTLQSVQNGVLGAPNLTGADGGPAFSGFVADLGRLPIAALEDRGAKGQVFTFNELWMQPIGMAAFDYRIPTGIDADAEVRVPCGWRGPYLRLPAGSFRLLDGWGTELVTPVDPVKQAADFPYSCLRDALDNPITTSSIDKTIYVLRSPGQNKKADVADTGYDADLTGIFRPTDFIAQAMGVVEINVIVSAVTDKNDVPVTDAATLKDATDKARNAVAGAVLTKVFGPDSDNGLVAAFQQSTASAVSGGQASFLILNDAKGHLLTAGPPVMRAYYTVGFNAVSGMAITPPPTPIMSSLVIPVALQPGANVLPRVRIPIAVTVKLTT